MRTRERPAAGSSWAVLAMGFLLSLGIGCAGGRPTGPVFEPLAPPDATATLLYVYRLDALRGVGGARVKLDDEKVGALRNGEYTAFVVDPGTHELRASVLWLGLIARSWNGLGLKTRGGETVYVRLRVATEASPEPPNAAEIPGRNDDRGGPALYLKIVPRQEALLELRAMRRAPQH
jgi:hypothetical protein